MNDNSGKLSYFDYCNLARQEYDNLLKVHPELFALSPRELEVFENCCQIKHCHRYQRSCSLHILQFTSIQKISIRSWAYQAVNRYL